MIIDVYPPQSATQIDWIKVITPEPQRSAADPPETTLARVHLPTGEVVAFTVPDRPK